jgi:hypothetical protein
MISEVNNTSAGFGLQTADQGINDKMKQKLQSQKEMDEAVAQGDGVKEGRNENSKESSGVENSEKQEKQAGRGMSEEEFRQKAQSMGVPENIIQQGMQATKAWIMENKEDSASESLFDITV